MPPGPILRRLGPADAFRALRLEGLQAHPEAFGATWESEAGQPASWWAERLERPALFGGWRGTALLGIAGVARRENVKRRHKALLWGMQVRPEERGSGLGAALVACAAKYAAAEAEELLLTVTQSNAAAVRLYARAGFRTYGLERRALRMGDQYHDILLMALPLPRGAADDEAGRESA